MQLHLNEAVIARVVREAADGARKELQDLNQRGLWLRIGKSGSRTWALRVRDHTGRFRIFTLGRHPAMGLSEAREAARRLWVEVRDGSDPTAARRIVRTQAQATAPAIDTFGGVLDIYEAQCGRHLKSWPHSRLRITRVFKPFLARSVQSLTHSELQEAADAYQARPSAIFAVRTLLPALRWAAKRKLVPAALLELTPPGTIARRQRVLSRDELARLLPALRSSERPHGAALRFMLLTLARREEVCGARWREIDMVAGTWSLPAERTKNAQPHLLPLSRQAFELLRARLPANLDPDGFIFANSKGIAIGHWDLATKALQAASATSNWHRHDLRRTGATMLGEMGELPDIIEATLNHVSIHSAVAATYNRSRYRPQVATALQRLADALDGMEAGAAEVVTLARGA